MTRLKKRIYLYPISSEDKIKGIYNPYMDDLKKALSEHFKVVNSNKPTNKGILDFLKYLTKIDYIFLNWIEKVPEYRFGFMQTVFLFFLIPVFKVFRIKIVWTMHNKLSHSGKHMNWIKAIFRLMLRSSDVILTHSNEGIAFGNEIYPGSAGRIAYFAHPVKDRRTPAKGEKKFDVLIWGTISPYKGIDLFLEYIYNNQLQNKYRILIVGSASGEYASRLKNYENEYIKVRNEFISDSALKELIDTSHIVLFTYSKESILSSGALMDSLGYGAKVAGPHVGAFADLAGEGIIKTFSGFDELDHVIESSLNVSDLTDGNQKLEKFLKENSWEKFAENVVRILEKKD
jgi:beta-1,4-mannosyltransferase